MGSERGIGRFDCLMRDPGVGFAEFPYDFQSDGSYTRGVICRASRLGTDFSTAFGRNRPFRGRSRRPLLHRWMPDVKGFGITSLARHPGHGRVRSGHRVDQWFFCRSSAN